MLLQAEPKEFLGVAVSIQHTHHRPHCVHLREVVGSLCSQTGNRMNDWISALYFVVISMLTVGYGDITPFTNIGKVFTGALLILGAIWSALFIIFSLGVLEFRDEEFRSYACKG